MSEKQSKIIFIALLLSISIYALRFYPRWQTSAQEATIGWDVTGYYFYLPTAFIYKDLKHCAFGDSIIKKYQGTPDFQQATKHEASGNYVIKYTCGQAIAMSPWFAVAHIWASNFHKYPADGFSYPYQACIGIGMFLYALLGLYYLRKVLLKFYSPSIATFTLTLIAFGTNYLNYAAVDQGMTHSTTFTLVAMLLWQTIKFWEAPNTRRAVMIGLLCGFATLVRPTDVVIVLLPVLWQINNFAQIQARFRWLTKNAKLWIAASLAFCAVVFIQLAYYKYVTGEWLVYSYGDQGFDWLSPNTWRFMFSYKCGWFMYCPLMLLPFLGIFIFIKQKQNVIAILVSLLLAIYVVTSWHIWDYGVTSGRAMIQYYPLLAFPFAALLSWLGAKNLRILIATPVVGFFAYISIWWCYNAHRGEVPVVDLTKQYYWHMLGRWHADEQDLKLLDTRYSYKGELKNIDTLLPHTTLDTSFEAGMLINNEHEYSMPRKIAKTGKEKKYIRAIARLYTQEIECTWWQKQQFILSFSYKGVEQQNNHLQLPKFLKPGDDKLLWIDAIPPVQWDTAAVLLWSAGSTKVVYGKSLSIITFDD
jgi:hypothetical protein